MVNIGDKVVITKLNGEVLEDPRVATVKGVGGSWFEIGEEIIGEDIVMKDSSVDEWFKADSPDSLIDNERVKVGDTIAVTKVNHEELERVHFAEVTGVYDDFDRGIDIEPPINGEDVLYIDQDKGDKWRILYEKHHHGGGTKTPKEGQLVKVVCEGRSEYGEVVETDVTDAGEYEFKIKSGESSTTYKMNEVDSIETYKGDEDKIMPNYNQLASGGMTFSEFAGEKITEESLDFRSIETYKGDEDKIMPNYIELATGGMTFSEFAGEKITEETLNFRPYDDKVNHPNHYNKYSREVIESIKGLCTPDEFRGYLKGNIIKYSARYSDKDGIQDIDKLAKYTQFLKEFELEMAELSEEE